MVGPSGPSTRREPAGEPRPYARDRAQILRRLARMEGQVRGVARMVERDETCLDVLQQTAALRAAVDSLTMLLMEDHVHGCLDASPALRRERERGRRGHGGPAPQHGTAPRDHPASSRRADLATEQRSLVHQRDQVVHRR